MKKIITLLLLVILCVTFTVNVSAASYTYDYEGNAVESPDAYTVEFDVNGNAIGAGKLKSPTDIKISQSGTVVISDYENARVLITDITFKPVKVLSTFEKSGVLDSLASPTGLCFDKNENLYVCDKEKGRIVKFDKQLNFVLEIANPNKELLPEGFSFSPTAVAVDKWGTVYCISDSSTNGYLQFDKTGVFKGFMGSPTTTLTMTQKLWRYFQTDEQRKRTVTQIPVNYNNIFVDSEGFVYTTEAHPNKEGVAISIQGREKSGLFMPIKKFNFNGSDVLKRLGFYAPAGDINFEKNYAANEREEGPLWASSICSLALGDDGCYFAADSKRGKIFAYDKSGNLLYAFGGIGAQKGLFSMLISVAYYDGKLYALDQNQGTITCFRLTEYGEELHTASRLTNERKFDEATKKWEELLSKNQNLTVAYIGLGRTNLESGNYAKAMSYFKTALDMPDYNEAFSRNREQILGDWFLAIPIAAILFILLISFAFAKMNKFNMGVSENRYKFSGNLIYSSYVIFHPFDGFWDLKHEKRGSVKAAAIFLSLASVCVAIQNRFSGFSFNMGRSANPLFVVLVIIGAALVFCLSNWCLTSLTDGKGSFKDIFMTVGYSSVPLIIMSLPITIMSNILTSDEAGFVTLFIYIAYIWTGILLFTGVLTVHQYSLGRNVISVIITLIGMVVIVFLAFLLINLGSRISSFVTGIVNELGLRG